jgi:UDP-N-acetylmuramate: L-alanyl-gamma-D-glutamyl-meso-diaminopimelate ligase
MKVHITGIGGIAMGNLAKMLKDAGHCVTGSDTKLYPPMSTQLAQWGFIVQDFSEDNIIESNGFPKADLYIVGNVISRGNIEVETILNYNLPIMSLPEALYEFFIKRKKSIVVAGTHGKTTTTFLIHYILEKADFKPGLFAGGIRSDGHPGFAIAKGQYFVIEGDEYDTSFFDKQPKFLHYRPYYLILTSIEFDHADIYKDIEHYKRSFELLLRWIPQKGKIIANYDYSIIRQILNPFNNVIYYSQNFYEYEKSNNKIYSFRYKQKDLYLPWTKVNPKIFGVQNYLNILAASLLARELNVDLNIIMQSIEEFPGVLRRQQLRKKILFDNIEIEFYEDFAHHPTAIYETIRGFKESFPDAFLISCYEPRSATSHRNVFQKEYPKAFLKSDAIYLTEIYNPQKVSEELRLNVQQIVYDIKTWNPRAYYCKNPQELLERLKNHILDYIILCKKNEWNKIILLFMSNGDFGNIYPEIENWLEQLELKSY